jgi:hypothetical protein
MNDYITFFMLNAKWTTHDRDKISTDAKSSRENNEAILSELYLEVINMHLQLVSETNNWCPWLERALMGKAKTTATIGTEIHSKNLEHSLPVI